MVVQFYKDVYGLHNSNFTAQIVDQNQKSKLNFLYYEFKAFFSFHPFLFSRYQNRIENQFSTKQRPI